MSAIRKKQNAGVLLHISSLPNGNLGVDAYRFVDLLATMGATVWQTLPINMPKSSSPYQCISTHAGDPALICSQQLIEENLLQVGEEDLTSEAMFEIAYRRFLTQGPVKEFDLFCASEAFWLNDFALFLLLRKQHIAHCWNTWPATFKHREQKALSRLETMHAPELQVTKFTQYLFFKQWDKLKAYAHKKHVRLFGDIPIFVAYDSADVWAQPHLFKLNEQKKMSVVAGVPPDYFSETGQRWGNPHYDWHAMEKDQFSWWVARIKTQAHLFDLLRIDHFRGLEAAWEIPAEEDSAINGYWEKAPGDALLAILQEKFPDIPLIAEDLGIITDEVTALRLKYALPGMKILQFAFDGNDNNPYLPQNIEENSVTYTGTHDNDTTLGWFTALDESVRLQIESRLNALTTKPTPMPFSLIETALNTKSALVIIPMQDIMELGSEHRMNIPGTIEGNWAWQFDWDQLTAKHIYQFSEALRRADRA